MTRDEIVMYLNMAGWHRERAAKLAGVSRATFQRAMRRERVRAPRSDRRLRRDVVERLRGDLLAMRDRDLGALYGVSASTIARARNFDTWKD